MHVTRTKNIINYPHKKEKSHKYIEQNFDNFEFCWITDGNYWLTNQGKNRFLNLLNHFKTIYNINLFAENIDSFK